MQCTVHCTLKSPSQRLDSIVHFMHHCWKYSASFKNGICRIYVREGTEEVWKRGQEPLEPAVFSKAGDAAVDGLSLREAEARSDHNYALQPAAADK